MRGVKTWIKRWAENEFAIMLQLSLEGSCSLAHIEMTETLIENLPSFWPEKNQRTEPRATMTLGETGESVKGESERRETPNSVHNLYPGV